MCPTKAEVIEQFGNSISNQEALVKKVQGIKINKSVKRVIPAGKTLHEDIPEQRLPGAVYNWLRATTKFSEGLISLVKDPRKLKPKEERVLDFEVRGTTPEWEIRGKRWLAERIAEILMKDNVIGVKIEKTGLVMMTCKNGEVTPESEEWQPFVELVPVRHSNI